MRDFHYIFCVNLKLFFYLVIFLLLCYQLMTTTMLIHNPKKTKSRDYKLQAIPNCKIEIITPRYHHALQFVSSINCESLNGSGMKLPLFQNIILKLMRNKSHALSKPNMKYGTERIIRRSHPTQLSNLPIHRQLRLSRGPEEFSSARVNLRTATFKTFSSELLLSC